jgi:AcrR family transcriptional regulator
MKDAAVLDRRAKLLSEVADYILSNGLADLSLRPLAATINTSPRMLLYFFGSKERLIAEALAHIRTREQLDFRRAVSRSRSAEREGLLLREWKSWSSPRREKYLRLFFEVYGLALQNRERFPGFLEGAVSDWLPLVARAFAVAVASDHAQALATFGLAAVRGLQLDLLATGERARTEAAFQEMLRLFSLAIRSGTKSNASRRKDGRRPRGNSKPCP